MQLMVVPADQRSLRPEQPSAVPPQGHVTVLGQPPMPGRLRVDTLPCPRRQA